MGGIAVAGGGNSQLKYGRRDGVCLQETAAEFIDGVVGEAFPGLGVTFDAGVFIKEFERVLWRGKTRRRRFGRRRFGVRASGFGQLQFEFRIDQSFDGQLRTVDLGFQCVQPCPRFCDVSLLDFQFGPDGKFDCGTELVSAFCNAFRVGRGLRGSCLVFGKFLSDEILCGRRVLGDR